MEIFNLLSRCCLWCEHSLFTEAKSAIVFCQRVLNLPAGAGWGGGNTAAISLGLLLQSAAMNNLMDSALLPFHPSAVVKAPEHFPDPFLDTLSVLELCSSTTTPRKIKADKRIEYEFLSVNTFRKRLIFFPTLLSRTKSVRIKDKDCFYTWNISSLCDSKECSFSFRFLKSHRATV